MSGDELLRRLERQYHKDPSCDKYRLWLNAARRAGQPFFTPAGIVLATGGQLLSFQDTVDGFKAEVKDATRPQLLVKIRVGPDFNDWEYERFDNWSGTIYIDCDVANPLDPSIVIDAQVASGGSNYGFRTSAVYNYIESPAVSDVHLIAACLDNRYYPVDRHGWDTG